MIIADLYLPLARLGPGSEAHTLLAARLAGLTGRTDLRIADLGCGTGASALVLARLLRAHVTAVDQFASFADEVARRAAEAGVADLVTPVVASMAAPPFEAGSLDVIWSEGAVYNLGFEAGVAAWRPLLKAGGVLAVSEITWIGTRRPAALQAFWEAEYAEIDVASAKIAALERQGYDPVGYFLLPPQCWHDYYAPLAARLPSFLAEQGHSDEARALASATEDEIALYEANQAYFSYGFYIARKSGA